MSNLESFIWLSDNGLLMLDELISDYLNELNLGETAKSFNKKIQEIGGVNRQSFGSVQWWIQRYIFFIKWSMKKLPSTEELSSMKELTSLKSYTELLPEIYTEQQQQQPAAAEIYTELNSSVNCYLQDLGLTHEAALFECYTTDNSVDYSSFQSIRLWIAIYFSMADVIEVLRSSSFEVSLVENKDNSSSLTGNDAATTKDG